MATNAKNKREKIHVKNETNFVETYVDISQKKIRINSELTYFWYKSRSIKSTKGGYSGQLLDGRFDRFSLNNSLIEQGQFKRGLKNGFWRAWFENGELRSICKYKKGLKQGKEVIYDDQGLVISELKYSKGTVIF